MFSRNRKSLFLLLLYNYVTGLPPNPFINILTSQTTCGYQSCPQPNPNSAINIHIVPHTHFDLGWLETVDEYFNVDGYGVYQTINSIVEALMNDTSRTFVFCEASYLSFWWEAQTVAYRQLLQTLINVGNVEIVGGGWSMNDEAVTHYHPIIDQLTWGLRKLEDMFGKCGRPKVAWQIDTFGHSAEMASIVALMKYDGLFLGRIDYQDKYNRFSTGSAEFVWTGNPDLEKETQVFTSILPNTYNPPFDLCVDRYCHVGNLDDHVIEQALTELESKLDGYITSNIIATMGGDNHYSDASFNFENIEKIMAYVKIRNSSISMFYSTPSCYEKAVVEEIIRKNRTWPRKTGDFFPYAIDHHDYWTGFFSSRPCLKRLDRMGNNYLQVCKQLFVTSNLTAKYMGELEKMISEMGILQHHDAITGTSLQTVANDYVKRLMGGFSSCDTVTTHALNKLSKPGYFPEGNSGPIKIDFQSCLLANISSCNVSEKRKRFVVTVYNPLSRSVNHYVRLPVVGLGYVVTDPKGNNITVDIFPLWDKIKNTPGRSSKAVAEIVFLAEDVPPLGFKSYFVQRSNRSSLITANAEKYGYKLNGIEVRLNNKTGKLAYVKMNGKKVNITQDFLCYNGVSIDTMGKTSGAYVFRPNGRPIPTSPRAEWSLYEGKLAVEFRQTFGKWTSVVIRIYKTENFVEFDWIVGPVSEDIYHIHGREIIAKYATSLSTKKVFYTDSNGRQMLKRVRNERPTYTLLVNEPIAGNYYPVTSKISLRDKTKDIEVSILTDRAQGGSSVEDGEIELMLYRLLAADDGHGLDEVLREKAFGEFLVIRGSHYLVVGPYRNRTGPSIAAQRDIAQRKILSSWVFLSRTTKTQYNYYNDTFRMENLFSAFEIVSFEEMTLGANLKIGTKPEIDLGINKETSKTKSCNHTSATKFHIVLCPMEIRTFIVSIKAT